MQPLQYRSFALLVRTFLSVAILAVTLTPAASRGEENPQSVGPPKELVEAFETLCIDCHNGVVTEGEFDLTRLVDETLSDHLQGRMLAAARRRVAAGEMPPEDAGDLDSDERAELLRLLVVAQERIREALRDDPGPVVMSRLTPYQYRNVVRDLSGGVVTDAGRLLPSEGGAGEGFANVGQAQGMSVTQLEKYLEAAKDALRHLRVYPLPAQDNRLAPGTMVWRPNPREPVLEPADARKELTDEIIAWHVAQQQKWNAEHRQQLSDRFTVPHAVYLAAAWRYRWRHELGRDDQNLRGFAEHEGAPLAPVVLEKWLRILEAQPPSPPFQAWAKAWQALPGPNEISAEELWRRCVAIETGEEGATEEPAADFAPPYELSFHETREEVLAAAEQGRWPFRIEVTGGEELFLVATDAGDGNRGEYAVWRQGRIRFRDGSARPWQELVTVVGANSGRPFEWGVDGENASLLGPDSIGVRPPGALKFTLPDDAVLFEVELALDSERTDRASIQALVLKEKPRSQSYISGRAVFGGKPRGGDSKQDNKELTRALRKRNIAEANRTKIGLNAERNVFANWTRSTLEQIGGPWPEQDADRAEPQFPYHLTVEQVRRNATAEDLRELAALEDKLVAVVQPHHQALAQLAAANSTEPIKEGVPPEPESLANWEDEEARGEAEHLRRLVDADERRLLPIARRIIHDFAVRSWRRPLSGDETDLLLELYRRSREQGFSFDASVKSSLLAVLISPHFLYQLPVPVADGQTDIVALTDNELASRLAFFLWASLPDVELVQVAAEGRLRDPDVLRSQAARMLEDRRARSLAVDFASQLFGFADFERFQGPDEARFPEFTAALRESMRGEVVRFLTHTFQHDRPLTELLAARHTFVDAALAEHYELELPQNPDETGFGRAALDSDSRRGGLAGMALFLTQTSLPLRTSPVQRGVWIAERLLGRELPNPPADVPPLSEDDTNEAGESIRQQLERHRAQASCAACHDRIDPFGVALESFDPIGRLRATKAAEASTADLAVTAEGQEIAGPSGLKQYLVQHQDEFLRYFHRKLLGYALGRAVHPGDEPLLERMHQIGLDSDHHLQPLIEAIVTSPQFTTRRVVTRAVARESFPRRQVPPPPDLLSPNEKS